MFFKIFNFSAEKTLAHDLVVDLKKDLPPTLMEKQRKVLSVNKITRLLEKTYQVAREHQNSQGMGFIKRSILANSFKWELKNLGYPEDFIDMATEGLVMELMRKDSISGK